MTLRVDGEMFGGFVRLSAVAGDEEIVESETKRSAAENDESSLSYRLVLERKDKR